MHPLQLFRDYLGRADLSVQERAAGFLTVLFPLFYLVGSAVADIAAALVSVLFLAECATQRDWRWVQYGWVKAAGLLGGYFILRGAFAEEAADAVIRAATWLRYPLFAAALAFWTLRRQETRDLLFIMLIFSLFFLLLDGLAQYCIGFDLFGREPLMSQEGSWRLTGPFKDPKLGIVLAWLSFPVLSVCVAYPSPRTFPLGMLALLLVLLVVFLSGERMALLLTLFGCALLGFCNRAMREKMILLAIGALLMLGITAYFNPTLLTRQYYSTVKTIRHYQDSPYGEIWRSSLAMVREHPVFGVGGKHFRLVCPRPAYGDMARVKTRCNLHPHQFYLEWLVEAGVLGLTLFIGLLGMLAKPVARTFSRLRYDPLALGLIIALILRIWPLSTSTSFFVAWSALPFWLIVGWLLALAYQQQEHEKC